MDHYFDIRLRLDPEFPAHQLWSALYSKLHRALVQLGSNAIGVSFPDVSKDGKHLGHCLRLHGSAVTLQQLSGHDWLTGMRDHVLVNEPQPAPAATSHRSIRRIQVQSNAARLRRRLIQRKGISEVDAALQIPDSAARQTDLPFVMLRSHSTGQSFPLFIDHGSTTGEAIIGPFNTYGLSQTATIPMF